MKNTAKKPRGATTAENLVAKFDNGEDVLDYFDASKARVIYPKEKRVQVVFPEWLVKALDHEASRLGMNRQDLIKAWVAERLGKAA